ncbi:tRNA 5-methoxyuridine(34)/uridine 5-oxyacetic acid(34) synthase CmoB [Helicobacter mustelae]|uniref:Putative methyltransferase n=1 Tax=Helicobacter mustelae (strain ATCC 43772 / CCUG 25715 / CIP 103759 / LMG 18044 / NCTC 12198 / R85-136P) TaxID=679897 RepID=D3UJI9_HELM1|nr:tRNA 5-methoxyuridine(34)/uridine 5-oxyacetic acid(34) synthase CmoB [Helicobacter mustelae]CBG40665.1 putative methyltransferase [Helicobacter mustelae 12198]SQH72162.1 methyltransferase [Helicobacter mustelae]STP13307.1 methyltransferase [Helicobacter mustelae]
MNFKNPKIKELFEKISTLPKLSNPCPYHCENGVHINLPELCQKDQETITNLARALLPWRKGPFYLGDLFIDSEWRSFMKWEQIAPHVNLEQKDVADIGCNNGYYLWEMLKHNPKSLMGFDPGEIFYAQFCFLNHFLQTPIVFQLLGVEDLRFYEKKFDVIFCLGVLYHRSDPISALKLLARALREDGELVLDTLIIDDDKEVALTPKESYAKMKNVYFIPSIPALLSWCFRAKLELIEIINIKATTLEEQRKTEWMDSLSLDSFVDLQKGQTIEGYPLPKRAYFKFKRMKNARTRL